MTTKTITVPGYGKAVYTPGETEQVEGAGAVHYPGTVRLTTDKLRRAASLRQDNAAAIEDAERLRERILDDLEVREDVTWTDKDGVPL